MTNQSNSFGAWASLITIVSLPIILYQLSEILTSPDVELDFVDPTAIAFKAVNDSGAIAEDVLVSFGVFDIDSNPPTILPIPTRQIDYINANSAKGPWSLLEGHATLGHRYFGIVYVGCRGARDLNTYWIYSEYGDPNEAFYVKRNKKDTYDIDPGKVRSDEKYLDTIAPLRRRIYIKK